MSRKRIDAALDLIVETRRQWEDRLWRAAEEAGSLLSAIDPQRRRSLLAHMRMEILIAQGRRCAICEESIADAETHEDHIVPISLGGGNERGNLRLVHAKCNLERGNDMYGHVDLYLWIRYIEDRVRNLPSPGRLALIDPHPPSRDNKRRP